MRKVFNRFVEQVIDWLYLLLPTEEDNSFPEIDSPLRHQTWYEYTGGLDCSVLGNEQTFYQVIGHPKALKMDLLMYSKLVEPPKCVIATIGEKEIAFFTSLDDANKFKEWRKEIRAKFFDGEETLVLPVVLEGTVVSGYMATHIGALSFSSETSSYSSEPEGDYLVSAWEWIITNCTGVVKITQDCFIFSDESDFALFILSPPEKTSVKSKLKNASSAGQVLTRSRLTRISV